MLLINAKLRKHIKLANITTDQGGLQNDEIKFSGINNWNTVGNSVQAKKKQRGAAVGCSFSLEKIKLR